MNRLDSLPRAIWPAASAALRARVLWKYRAAARRKPTAALRYLAVGRELSNFTYDIDNYDELVDFVGRVVDAPLERVRDYVQEILADVHLLQEVGTRLSTHRDRTSTALLGRRVGWYAICRCVRPSLVVETGTRDGLGTSVLARAIQKNAEEAAIAGRVATFDIDDRSGWAVPGALREYVDMHVGDARQMLPTALHGRRVDVFIHDSLHTYDHERFEFDVAFAHGCEIVMSDNAHATTALADFARERGWSYSFFRERPIDHFYPGGGIGVATPRSLQQESEQPAHER